MDPGTLINGIKLELNDLSKFVFTLNPLGWCVGNIFIKSSWQHNLYSLPEATDSGTGHHHHGQRRRHISGLHFTSFRAIRSLYWEWEGDCEAAEKKAKGRSSGSRKVTSEFETHYFVFFQAYHDVSSCCFHFCHLLASFCRHVCRQPVLFLCRIIF